MTFKISKLKIEPALRTPIWVRADGEQKPIPPQLTHWVKLNVMVYDGVSTEDVLTDLMERLL